MSARLCDKSIRCPDPSNPMLGVSSTTPRPVIPPDEGIVFGDPNTGIVFGIPDDNIAFGIPIPVCPSIRCPGDPFLNYSTECDDVDYLKDQLVCLCIGDPTNIFIRSPGIGPFIWTVNNLPEGLGYTINKRCEGILNITGSIVNPGRYFVDITVLDGFGNLTKGTVQFNAAQIATTSLPAVVIGSPYSLQLQAAGGSGNFAWKIVAGALAPGLGLTVEGLIFGTPTDVFPPSVTIECIDLECETPDITFKPPYVLLNGDSVTTTAKIIGFPGFTSLTPPKAYKTVSWIGNVTNGNAHTGDTFLGYCGATSIDVNGNEVSARMEQGYFKVHNGGAPVDLQGPCVFGTVIASNLIGADFHVPAGAFNQGPSQAVRDAVYGLVGEAGYNHVTDNAQAEKKTFGSVGSTIYTVDRTVILLDEYTDADALSVATMLAGTGLVATSLPRTTGWISQFVSVTFTLTCHNLMLGQDYIVSVDFLHSDGTTTTQAYPFTATSGDNTITDTIPTPADGTWTLATNPRIAIP